MKTFMISVFIFLISLSAIANNGKIKIVKIDVKLHEVMVDSYESKWSNSKLKLEENLNLILNFRCTDLNGDLKNIECKDTSMSSASGSRERYIAVSCIATCTVIEAYK
jgi:hypothetical protein